MKKFTLITFPKKYYYYPVYNDKDDHLVLDLSMNVVLSIKGVSKLIKDMTFDWKEK